MIRNGFVALIVAVGALGALVVVGNSPANLFVAEANAAEPCQFKFCGSHQWRPQQTRTTIRNDRGQRVGDLYDPGHSRPLQVRDNHGRVRFLIEDDGELVNKSGQRIGNLGADE